ncbi:formate dehydrogenase accessory sulfurtransferase FdhD [Rhodococcus aetherivorans]|uniref:formate dehydrogenase accessory sulfurtransferase FdhD n=1 Tax=Rhodococcus aetherivorans TaxID=191292 RepID=UPI0036706CEE
MGRVTTRTRITRIHANRQSTRPDTVVVEEPLELRVNGTALAVTMRTPGSDIELAQGFLLTEGIVGDRGDIAAIRQRTRHAPADDPVVVDPTALSGMPHTLREAQKVFDRTGGLHAAGLFTATGDLLALREDVGRHNAVDKIVGWATENHRIPARGTVLLVSGRASFELAQKTVMAGIPVLAAVSAPSSLAIDLADESGLTLVGFLREDTMNIYTHPHRIGV